MSAPDSQTFARREADWRNGAVVYQVIVDRFAPPADLSAKQALYPHPKRLRAWDELPERGAFLPDHHVYAHEVDFWGGDLNSLRARLDYLSGLDVDVLYLNPIHSAFTNHKYDAYDYQAVSPEYGSLDDLRALVADAHGRRLKVVLDGVFNHMGRNSRLFTQAAASPDSPYRDWFYIHQRYPQGVRLWANAPSLPELNYENPAVCDYIYAAPDSVVRSYLRLGIDGWRLDTAFELGYRYLQELTDSAHQEKPGSLVVGELWNYPQDWFPPVDGVMNFTLRQILFDSLHGEISPGLANQMLARMIADAGVEPMLKSWVLLDNHDTDRLTGVLPDARTRRLAQVLQFTLPGAPNLYYGSELGMDGTGDPGSRAPMRWDLADGGNQTLQWTKHLIQMRRANRALRIGDYRALVCDQLIAFERCTERAAETLIVLANPTGQALRAAALIPDSKIMNGTRLVDLLEPDRTCMVNAGLIKVALEPYTAAVFSPQTGSMDGYTPYKRVE